MGDLLKIWITASPQDIHNNRNSQMSEGNNVQELNCNTTKEFKCETFWSIPKNTIPGTYTIKSYDAISSSETTFECISKIKQFYLS